MTFVGGGKKGRIVEILRLRSAPAFPRRNSAQDDSLGEAARRGYFASFSFSKIGVSAVVHLA